MFKHRVIAFFGLILLGLALPAQAAKLSIEFTRMGQPLSDPSHGKFYIYEPEKREVYLGWGNGMRGVEVPDGVYDVVLRYRNDAAVQERVLKEVELTGNVKRSIDFKLRLAELQIDVTSGGRPVERFTARYAVHRSGSRGKPVAAKRPGQPTIVQAGTYDIEISHRGPGGMQTRWLSNFVLEGAQQETVEVGSQPVAVRLTLLYEGRPLSNSRGTWRVYRPGSRSTPIAQGASGETLQVDPGVYDIGLFLVDGALRAEQWLTDYELFDNLQREVEIESATAEEPPVDAPNDRVALADPADPAPGPAKLKRPASLRVNVRGGDSRSTAWFAVYPRGRRSGQPVTSAPSGRTVRLESGTYDIACFVKQGDLRPVKWLSSRNVSGGTTLDVNMSIREATVRVRPSGSVGPARGPVNVLLILDSSAEMQAKVGGSTRMELARQAVQEVAGGLRGSRLKIGLRTFGIAPRAQRDCNDSLLLVPFGSAERQDIASTLDLLRPAGISPIAYSLERAAEDFDRGSRNIVVLITGSGESCAAAPCASAARLIKRGAIERFHVIGIDLDGVAERSVDCVGPYHRVDSPREMSAALREIFDSAAAADKGTVSIFRKGNGEWVAGGRLGQWIPLAADSYEMHVREGTTIHRWDSVKIKGTDDFIAGPRPRKR